MSLIDEDKIIYAEITSYINLDKGIKPTSFYLYMPSLDGTDYYTAGFDNNEYVATTKNFVATEPLKYYSVEEAKEFAANNGLSEPTEIKAILTHGRIGLFAYSIICDGKEYIIPYYFTNDSTYNITKDNTVRLSLGTAYAIEEFVSMSEKEHTLYEEYMNATGETDDVLRQKAEESVKTDMVIYYVLEAEGKAYTDDEYNEALDYLVNSHNSDGYNYDRATIEAFYAMKFYPGYLRYRFNLERVISLMFEYANIVEKAD